MSRTALLAPTRGPGSGALPKETCGHSRLAGNGARKHKKAVWHERAKALPTKAQPKAPPAASARAERDDGMEWGGCIARDPARFKEPDQHSMRFAYTVAGSMRLDGDDPKCVYHWCRVAIPRENYAEYRHTLLCSPRTHRGGGWFVAMPLAGECKVCKEAWSSHGSRCDEELINQEARKRWSRCNLPEEDLPSESEFNNLREETLSRWYLAQLRDDAWYPLVEDPEVARMRPWPSWEKASRLE